MSNQVLETLERLSIKQLDKMLFQGQPNDWPNRHVFGGHIVAQALEAADLTVPDGFRASSLHSYFLRPGNAERPVIYEVEAMRDGRSFLTRRVVAIQNGDAIFVTSINYHVGEIGLSHQPTMPEGLPAPETLENDTEYYNRALKELGLEHIKRANPPFDLRSIDPMDVLNPSPKDEMTGYWFKLKTPAPSDDPTWHARLLAYCSDFSLLSSCLRPHGVIARDKKIKAIASLDHSIWFAANDYRVDDDWLFYQTEGTWARHGRGLARGAIFERSGRMIASTAQEALLRLSDDAKEEIANN